MTQKAVYDYDLEEVDVSALTNEPVDDHIYVDVVEKLIHVTKPTVMLDVYHHLMSLFDEPGYMHHSIPMTATTPESFVLTNGWDLSEDSKRNIEYGGWCRSDLSKEKHKGKYPIYHVGERWAGVVILGNIKESRQVYYRVGKGPAESFRGTGMVAQSILWPKGEEIEIWAEGYQSDLGWVERTNWIINKETMRMPEFGSAAYVFRVPLIERRRTP
jgi:hypothetical protein